MNEQELKKALAKLLSEAKIKKAKEDELRAAKNEEDRRAIFDSVGKDLGTVIGPYIEKLKENSTMSAEEMKRIIGEAVKVDVPQIDTEGIQAVLSEAFANFKMPTPQVSVKVPEIRIPEIKMPKVEMPTMMKVLIEGVSKDNPLPVMMMDIKGKPMMFPMAVGGSGGGKTDFFTIKDIQNSSGGSLVDADGFLRVTGNFSASVAGASSVALVNSDGTYYNSDNPFPVTFSASGDSTTVKQLSGAIDSVNVVDAFGSTAVSGLFNADNRLRVSLETGGSGLTDTELRASSVPVAQASGASWSTEATQSGTWNIGTVTTVTGITNSLAASLVDSSGIQYSGSNPVPVSGSVTVSNTITSTIAVGSTVADAADDGSAPVQSGGVARTANPTAVAAGDVVKATFDDLGRQVIRHHQVRDLIQTAYVSVTNGTETTLRAGVAGAYLDLLMLVGSNNSDAAVSVAVRAVTAGNIIHTLMIPANGTAGFAPTVAWPQDATGNNWTVDGPDETGRTLTFSALFSQEI